MTAIWEVVGKRSLLRRLPWLEVYQEQVRLPSGHEVGDFFSIRIPEYVVVAGFDRHGNVLAERHYRHGAGVVTWSLPSGYIDPDEDAPQAARRELREETGFEAESWNLLGRFVVDGNRGCGWANIFIARGLHRVGLPDGLDLAVAEVRLVPRQQMIARMMRGEVAELASVAALALASIDATPVR